MELLSISQISDKSNISDPSIRRYITTFKESLPKGVKMGRGLKYPPEIVQRLKDISQWYHRGKSKDEIKENLELGKSVKTSSSNQNKDRFEILTEEIRTLNETIKFQTVALGNLTNLVSQVIPPGAQPKEGLTDFQRQISSLPTVLSESSNLPPNSQHDNKTNSSSIGNSKVNKKPKNTDIKNNSTLKLKNNEPSSKGSGIIPTSPSDGELKLPRDISEKDLMKAVPKKHRGNIAGISIKQAQEYFPNNVIESAIRYADTMESFDSPGKFFDMVKNVLRDGLHLGQESEPVVEPLVFEKTNEHAMEPEAEVYPLSFDAPAPKPEPEQSDKITPDTDIAEPEPDVSEKPVPKPAKKTRRKSKRKTKPEKAPKSKKDIDEKEIDIFSKEPIPKIELPNCHGKKLTVAERDRYLLRTEDIIEGKGKMADRAKLLNSKGILTGRGNEWTGKLVADNLNHARKRMDKL